MTRALRALAPALLAAGVALTAFAGWSAPYDPARQFRDHANAPPTPIRFRDAEGRRHLRPFVYATEARLDESGLTSYVELTDRAIPIRFLGTDDTGRRRLFTVDRPAQLFLFGTDASGRDLWSRVVHGGRLSLAVGMAAAAVALFGGAVLGALAGMAGGLADRAFLFLSTALLTLPWVYLLLAVRAALPLDLPPSIALGAMATTIAVVGWPRPSLLVRAVVLSARRSDYVQAARASGASAPRILVQHLLPQAWPIVRAQAALLVPQFVLAEVTLSFLGLGVGEPSATWGGLLATLRDPLDVPTYWWRTLPLCAVVLAFGVMEWNAAALGGRGGARRLLGQGEG